MISYPPVISIIQEGDTRDKYDNDQNRPPEESSEAQRGKDDYDGKYFHPSQSAGCMFFTHIFQGLHYLPSPVFFSVLIWMMKNMTRTPETKTGHQIFPPTKQVAKRITSATAVIQ